MLWVLVVLAGVNVAIGVWVAIRLARLESRDTYSWNFTAPLLDAPPETEER